MTLRNQEELPVTGLHYAKPLPRIGIGSHPKSWLLIDLPVPQFFERTIKYKLLGVHCFDVQDLCLKNVLAVCFS